MNRSVDDEDRTAGRASAASSISADGSVVAFTSLATDLVALETFLESRKVF